MAITFINEPYTTLPVINPERVKQRGTAEITDYLLLLIKSLQEDLLRAIVQIINLQSSMSNVGVFNFDLPDLNGVYADGSWRFIKLTDGIELQKKLAGTWEKVARWEY